MEPSHQVEVPQERLGCAIGERATDLEDEALAHGVEERLVVIAVRPGHGKGEGRGAVVEEVICRRIRCCTERPQVKLQA